VQDSKVAKSRKTRALKAPKETLRYTIANAIRQAIVDGIYVPGVPLSEIELAERFDVSRGPIREALMHLEREYLVRSFPNRGTFVSMLSETEFDEILRMRAVLEPLAIEFAAQSANSAQVEGIRTLLRTLVKLAEAGNHRDFADMDFQFHTAVWNAAGRPLLRDTLIQVSRPMFVFFQINWSRYERAGLSLVTVAHAHSLMLDYIERKTDLSAAECFRPIVDETEKDEKPVLMSTYTS